MFLNSKISPGVRVKKSYSELIDADTFLFGSLFSAIKAAAMSANPLVICVFVSYFVRFQYAVILVESVELYTPAECSKK